MILLTEQTCVRVVRSLVACGAPLDQAEDAVQDASEAFLRQADPPRDPAAWLFTVALRKWRRARWRARIFSRLSAELAGSVPGPSPLRSALNEALGRLTERERTVVVCRYVMGFSQAETAAALGIATGTVAAMTHRANVKLRQRLEDASSDS